jgi:hypothetical protein
MRTSALASLKLGRPMKKGQGFKPDLGNPAVRDYRGASGKRGHGGNEIPPRNRKSEIGNPPPPAGAPELYPDYQWAGRLSFEKPVAQDADSIPRGGRQHGSCVSRE